MNDSLTAKNLVIRASAGTGKTFQLTNRFLRLIAQGEEPERFLAVTFTRKAAGEILDRLLSRLAEAACGETAAKKLGKEIGVPALTRSASASFLKKIVSRLHRLQVGTLDGYFARLARGFALELQLPPGWRIADDFQDERLLRQSIAAALMVSDADHLTALVNLLTQGESTRGVYEMIDTDVRGLYQVYLDSDADAWKQWPKYHPLTAEKLDPLFDELDAAEIPSNKTMEKAHRKAVVAARDDDWQTFLRGGIAAKVAAGESTFSRTPISAELMRIYGALIAHARAVIIKRLQHRNEATWELLDQFHRAYDRRKLERGALNFSDVPRRLAAYAPLSDTTLADFRMDGSVDHVLLDEFQDTSLDQWRVIEPLSRRVSQEDTGTFFCVGDGKQAIYAWRGGVAEIFSALPTAIENLQTHDLNQSWRSAPAIIDCVNRAMSRLTQHDNLGRSENEVKRWQETFPHHTTAHTEYQGYACLRTSPAGDGDKKSDDVAALAFAADRVKELVARRPTASIGVLTAKNDAVTRMIFELQRRGVDASEEGGKSLTDAAGVRAILSLMRMIDHPGDTIARAVVTHGVIGDVLGLTPDMATADVLKLLSDLRRQVMDDGYGAAVERLVQLVSPRVSRREQLRLAKLTEFARAYDSIATLRADDFVRYIESQRATQPTAADVRVMTCHQAKGLQFDIVVLPQLEERLIGQSPPYVTARPDPHARISAVYRFVNKDVRALLPCDIQKVFEDYETEQTRESLCQLYVWLTRAKFHLEMIVPPDNEDAKPHEHLPQTFAGLLRAALPEAPALAAKPNAVLYEHGREDWTAPAQLPDTLAPAVVDHPPVLRLRIPTAPRRDLPRRSPSRHEEAGRIEVRAMLRPAGDDDALKRGTLFHTWLEQVGWLDEDGPPDETLLATIAGGQGFSAGETANLLEEFRAMLTAPKLAAALGRKTLAASLQTRLGIAIPTDAELALHCERAITACIRGEMISGEIDRLTLFSHGGRLIAADILDFKTDHVAEPAALQQRAAHYQPQLAAYREALAATTGLDAARIAMRLLFVGCDAEEPLP